MRELVKIDQDVIIVPKDFKLTNIGKVVDVTENDFKMKVNYPTEGIEINHICEFFSQTENGMLYFESYTSDMENNVLTVANPIKHRFLQRRKYTRIKFIQDLQLISDDIVHNVRTLDISAGGMKITTTENIDIEKEYRVKIRLNDEIEVNCKFKLIRVERGENGIYTISGRFTNQSKVDKMSLVQYCMNKNMENLNK